MIIMAEEKKSTGLDGISQDLLLLEAEIIAIPLTRLNKNWIESGKIFITAWKKSSG